MKTSIKLLIVIISAIIIVSTVVCIIVIPIIVSDIFGLYHESDSQKMMVYLNDRYGLIFPKSVCNVQAATATTLEFSGATNTDFIMKFHIKPEEINEFLANFEMTMERMQVYDNGWNERSSSHLHYPDWYRTPIGNGRVGKARLTAKNIKGVSFGFDLYIDLSLRDYIIVYMNGCYKHEGDQYNRIKNK
jgi:hypothetical protein